MQWHGINKVCFFKCVLLRVQKVSNVDIPMSDLGLQIDYAAARVCMHKHSAGPGFDAAATFATAAASRFAAALSLDIFAVHS